MTDWFEFVYEHYTNPWFPFLAVGFIFLLTFGLMYARYLWGKISRGEWD